MSCISLGMMLTLLAWVAERFVSSKGLSGRILEPLTIETDKAISILLQA